MECVSVGFDTCRALEGNRSDASSGDRETTLCAWLFSSDTWISAAVAAEEEEEAESVLVFASGDTAAAAPVLALSVFATRMNADSGIEVATGSDGVEPNGGVLW